MARYRYPRDGNGQTKDQNGQVITGATVSCYLAGTTTPASIYAANVGGTAVNSVTSSATDGTFVFYTDNGDYAATQLFKVVISKTNYTSTTNDNIAIIDAGGVTAPGTTVSGNIVLWNDVTGSSISDSGVLISTDGTMATNSDVKVSTEKAIKTYADTVSAAKVSDTAYGAGWDGVTTIAPSKNAVYDKVSTLMNLSGSNLAIGSDADGDMYYRAASVLARLPKGAANLKQFMNAGATAPEWASGIYVGTLTRDLATASGSVSYTGVGFKPKVILFIGYPPTGGSTHMSWGFSDGTTGAGGCVVGTTYYPISDFSGANGCIALAISAGGTYQTAILSSMDADGFTLAWTKTGSPTGVDTVAYLAFR